MVCGWCTSSRLDTSCSAHALSLHSWAYHIFFGPINLDVNLLAITGLIRPSTAGATSVLTFEISGSRETSGQQTKIMSSTVLIIEWCCDAAALALGSVYLNGTTVQGGIQTYTYYNY